MRWTKGWNIESISLTKLATAGALALALLLQPSTARAQARRTYWGLEAVVTPAWESPNVAKVLFDADSVTFKGSEFRIGFVRGQILGGEWGVSFVQKPINDSLSVARHVGSGCSTCGQFLAGPGTSLSGIEIHKFAPFGTIKSRVQIGIEGAVGVAKLRGTVQETIVSASGPNVPPTTQATTVNASTLFAPGGSSVSVFPLARIELTGTGVITPEFKIRASGGFDFPGYGKFSIGVVYLIGVR